MKSSQGKKYSGIQYKGKLVTGLDIKEKTTKNSLTVKSHNQIYLARIKGEQVTKEARKQAERIHTFSSDVIKTENSPVTKDKISPFKGADSPPKHAPGFQKSLSKRSTEPNSRNLFYKTQNAHESDTGFKQVRVGKPSRNAGYKLQQNLPEMNKSSDNTNNKINVMSAGHLDSEGARSMKQNKQSLNLHIPIKSMGFATNSKGFLNENATPEHGITSSQRTLKFKKNRNSTQMPEQLNFIGSNRNIKTAKRSEMADIIEEQPDTLVPGNAMYRLAKKLQKTRFFQFTEDQMLSQSNS